MDVSKIGNKFLQGLNKPQIAARIKICDIFRRFFTHGEYVLSVSELSKRSGLSSQEVRVFANRFGIYLKSMEKRHAEILAKLKKLAIPQQVDDKLNLKFADVTKCINDLVGSGLAYAIHVPYNREDWAWESKEYYVGVNSENLLAEKQCFEYELYGKKAKFIENNIAGKIDFKLQGEIEELEDKIEQLGEYISKNAKKIADIDKVTSALALASYSAPVKEVKEKKIAPPAKARLEAPQKTELAQGVTLPEVPFEISVRNPFILYLGADRGVYEKIMEASEARCLILPETVRAIGLALIEKPIYILSFLWREMKFKQKMIADIDALLTKNGKIAPKLEDLQREKSIVTKVIADIKSEGVTEAKHKYDEEIEELKEKLQTIKFDLEDLHKEAKEISIGIDKFNTLGQAKKETAVLIKYYEMMTDIVKEYAPNDRDQMLIDDFIVPMAQLQREKELNDRRLGARVKGVDPLARKAEIQNKLTTLRIVFDRLMHQYGITEDKIERRIKDMVPSGINPDVIVLNWASFGMSEIVKPIKKFFPKTKIIIVSETPLKEEEVAELEAWKVELNGNVLTKKADGYFDRKSKKVDIYDLVKKMSSNKENPFVFLFDVETHELYNELMKKSNKQFVVIPQTSRSMALTLIEDHEFLLECLKGEKDFKGSVIGKIAQLQEELKKYKKGTNEYNAVARELIVVTKNRDSKVRAQEMKDKLVALDAVFMRFLNEYSRKPSEAEKGKADAEVIIIDWSSFGVPEVIEGVKKSFPQAKYIIINKESLNRFEMDKLKEWGVELNGNVLTIKEAGIIDQYGNPVDVYELIKKIAE